MPWRLLIRIASAVVFQRLLVRMRRGAAERSGRPGSLPLPSLSGLLPRLREDASVAARAISIAVLLVAAGALLIAGATAALLSPRWLGATLLTMAAATLLGAVLEAAALRRSLRVRGLRHRDDVLRRQR